MGEPGKSGGILPLLISRGDVHMLELGSHELEERRWGLDGRRVSMYYSTGGVERDVRDLAQ